MTPPANYPPTPDHVDPAIVKPSAAFKKSVVNVTLAMVLFVVVYVLLLTAAVAIAIAFGAAGIGVIYIYPSFLTLVLGLGLIISGVMLLYFLVKFIFKRNKIDFSDMVEVTAVEQPELFAFIKQLTIDTQAPFPKRVFLTANVNASVFYNSGFWSMFFPVKKNLQIGLGLVNCLNLSEFKAVMAHEFGHFSQRSMKFGSYTYQVNRVIYNMLYDNEGYTQVLNTLGSVHSFLRLGIAINIQLVRGIQGLLKKIYVIVNRNYLGLSREMEFHADAVSAYVSGSNHTVSSLLRIEVSQICYNNMFNYLNVLAKDKKRPENIYPQHLAVMEVFAADHQLKLDGASLPVMDKKLAVLNNSQIVIADQWSSHPSTDDRISSLNKIGIIAPTVTERAWVLFRKTDEIQALLSDMVYANEVEKYEKLDSSTALELFNNYAANNTYNPAYRGYYNSRYITEFDVDEVLAANYSNTANALDDVLTDTVANLPAQMRGIEKDIATVKAIFTNDQIKTFDFKGIKYKQIDAPAVEKDLDRELAEAAEYIKTADRDLFLFFYHHAASPNVIANAYKDIFKLQLRIQDDLAKYEKLARTMAPIYGRMSFDDIGVTMDCVYALEKDFKPYLTSILTDPIYAPFIEPSQKEAIEKYLSLKGRYFNGEYNQPALAIFNQGIDAFYGIVDTCYFCNKKQLLELQLDYVK